MFVCTCVSVSVWVRFFGEKVHSLYQILSGVYDLQMLRSTALLVPWSALKMMGWPLSIKVFLSFRNSSRF